MNRMLCLNVPSHDSVSLATDVYLPSGGGSFPVILVRTTYHRTGLQSTAPSFTSRGYAFVAQDCRGKYDSSGCFSPLIHEAADGQATLDWIANQSWCNGRIGMWGRSYLGIVQVPAAASQHEALKCIAPSVAPGSFFKDWLRYDGCFALANSVRWSLTHASSRTQPPLDHIDWDTLCRCDGPAEIAKAAGFPTPVLADWSAHDSEDEYWDAVDQERMHDRITIPGLHAGGWFDHLTRGQFNAYRNIRRDGSTDLARRSQRLYIGPWGHTTISAKHHDRYGDWSFGDNANVSVQEHELRFLDLHLKDIDDGIAGEAPVRVFELGRNRWIDLDDWPPSDATSVEYYLSGKGVMGRTRGTGDDSYITVTSDPIPTLGGPIYWGLLDRAGPVDQRPILSRDDVLYYRSEPLDRPLSILGPISLGLSVACDSEDADIIAKLCVEAPDGRVDCLTLGSLRLRFRNSFHEPHELPRNETVKVTLDLGNIAYAFESGSRIGLIVCSTDFPRILPNSHRIEPPWATKTPAKARISILRDAGSRLSFFAIEN